MVVDATGEDSSVVDLAGSDSSVDAGVRDQRQADSAAEDLESLVDGSVPPSDGEGPGDVGADTGQGDGSSDATQSDTVSDASERDQSERDTAEADSSMTDVGEVDEPGRQEFRIRFASYNVRTSNLNNSAWGDTNVGWDSGDAARMRRVADEVASQNLSVVAAQEIRGPERREILQRLSGQHGQNWGATSQKQGADDTMVLFDRSVWRKVEETHFLIPLQGDLRDRYQVGVLLEHKATGRVVWFYSVHYAAGGSSGAAARRTGAERTVRSIRNHAIANQQAFVLGGDFNATAGSEVGDIMRGSGFMKYTRNVAEKKVGNGCKTFNGNAGSAGNQSCPGGAAKHIDHVWVKKSGVQVVKYQVTATARTSRASDHNPVTTVLRRL